MFLLAIFTVVLSSKYTTAGVVAATGNHTGDDHNQPSQSSLYMEPDVRRYKHVLPIEICQQLIELGEANGFPLEIDSIDQGYDDDDNKLDDEKGTSQAIEVLDEAGTIRSPHIWAIIEPFVPHIAQLVKTQRDDNTLFQKHYPTDPDRPPRLGWVFYRKYAPDTERNSLKPHYDTNFHTVNIALNDDFEGGGLFYLKPPLSLNRRFVDGDDAAPNVDEQPIPDLKTEHYHYDWVNSLSRRNTSDVVFPTMATGDCLIHDYTVWHAVAPLERGVRYSMVLFFDLDNPALDQFRDGVVDEEDVTGMVLVAMEHGIIDCYGGMMDTDASVVWVEDERTDKYDTIEEDVRPNDITKIYTTVGAIFRVIELGTNYGRVLGEITIRSDVFEYKFLRSDNVECGADASVVVGGEGHRYEL